MSRIRWYGPTVVLLITLVAVMVAGPEVARQITAAQTKAQSGELKAQLENSPALEQLSGSFRKVAKVVEPSVVHIKVLKRSDNEASREMFERMIPPELRDRFNMPERDEQRDEDEDDMDRFNAPRQEGSGSGWVYDEDGHIVTNHHVVAGADEIRVRFHDGTEREAQVVNTDPRTDVAVVKVDHDSLQPLSIAEEPVSQGEIVFAFGSPFRFDFSMSQGIVSAKGRQLGIIRSYDEQTGMVTAGYENFIQTDAAINPGNSGGPLTNIYGEFVGMNTAIASRTGAYNGIGFAIPATMVTDVVDQIIKNPQQGVSRGYLGVTIRNLNETMAESYGLESTDGVLIIDALPGTPAAEAGVQSGDIIRKLDGTEVASVEELRYNVASMSPGTKVDVTVLRNGETKQFTVELGRLDEAQLSAAGEPTEPQEDEGATMEGASVLRKLGIEDMATFTPRLAERLDLEHRPGVIIESVRSNSIAAREGVSEGMIVTRFMGQAVTSVKELVQAVTKQDPTSAMRFRVVQWNPRNNAFMPNIVAMRLPESALE